MTSTVATLAWATPVDLVRLISHLQAYEQFKPAILALRACYRYGGQAPVARLSTELIDMITMELLKLEYGRAHLAWDQKAACYENRCTIERHLQVGDIDRIIGYVFRERERSHEASCPPTCNKECLSYQTSDHDVQKRATQDSTYIRAHDLSKRDWLASIDKNLIVNMIRKPLLANFGLDAVVSHHEVDVLSRSYLKHRMGISEPPSVIISSYLTLPSTSARFWAGFGLDLEFAAEPRFMHTSLVDPSSLVLTDEQRKRFARAMRLLALNVSFHPSQLSQALSASSSDHEIVDYEKTDVRCCYHNRDLVAGRIHRKDLKGMAKRLNMQIQIRSWPQLTMLLRQTEETKRL